MIPRCGRCNDIVECNTDVFKNGFRFKMKSNMNCRSKNIIYALICKHCSECYIGQTGCEMRQRMTVHKQQIRTGHLRCLPISKHMHQCSNDEFFVLSMYKMSTSDMVQRKLKEHCK